MSNLRIKKRKIDEDIFEEFMEYYKKKKSDLNLQSRERSESPDSAASATWPIDFLDESFEEPPEEGEIKEEEEVKEDKGEMPTITIEDEIEDEVLNLLGKGVETPEKSPKIHGEVAKLWNDILSAGMKKEIIADIVKKYPPTENITSLVTPKLNPEAELALNEKGRSRDKGIRERQIQIGAAIAALGGLLSEAISNKEIQPKLIIEKISDAGRILCNLFHSHTDMRKYLILNSVNKDLRESLKNRKPQEFLFGNNMSDTIKTAKAVARAGQDLKFKHLNYQNPPQPNNIAQQQRQGQRRVGRGSNQRRPSYQPQKINRGFPNNQQRPALRGRQQKWSSQNRQ